MTEKIKEHRYLEKSRFVEEHQLLEELESRSAMKRQLILIWAPIILGIVLISCMFFLPGRGLHKFTGILLQGLAIFGAIFGIGGIFRFLKSGHAVENMFLKIVFIVFYSILMTIFILLGMTGTNSPN